jgi:hypothetical protein
VIVSAVERVGDAAALGVFVLWYVGVEQVQFHPPHFHEPDLNPHHSGRQPHCHFEFAARGVADRSYRQRIEVVDRIAFLLPPVGIQILLQVAGLV